jgi:L-lactate dehydrogenase
VEKQQIDEQVRGAAYRIIAGKGASYYGIGSAVARLVDVLLNDQRAVLTICSRIQGVATCEGITLGLPHVVGGQGSLGTIPLPLDATEQQALQRSACILREAIESLKLT